MLMTARRCDNLSRVADLASYRVFLSYSRKDQDFARYLYNRLTRDGVSCFFEQDSIEWGANYVITLERALDVCEHVVLILTPDFCNSKWAQRERTSAPDKLLPLARVTCNHLSSYPRFLRPIQSLDVSTTEQFEANYPSICRKLGGEPRPEQNEPKDRTRLPPVHRLPERHRMPFLSIGDNFVGRVEPFWKLHDSLHRDPATIVQGILAGTGGIGKTQLAIEYAWRFGSGYPGGVYWVDADRGLSTLIAQVSGVSGIEIDGKRPEPEQLEQLWRGLNRLPGPSLLVLDNFLETGPLRPWLPTAGRVHTLVTTRRRDLGYPTIRLDMLSTEEGVQLLNSGSRKFNEADAAKLVDRLGGLPLALELAKSYLNVRHVSIADLLKEMDASSEIDLLAELASEYRDQLPSGHERDIAKTFQMSWDLATEPCRQVLRAMSELAPVGVPQSLLRTILDLPEIPGLRDPLTKAIDELVRLSLAERDGNGNPIAHRLILAFVRKSASLFEECRKAVQRQMSRADLQSDARTIRDLELLVPHAEALLATGRLATMDFCELSNKLGTHHQVSGRFLDAKRTLVAALASAENVFTPDNLDIAALQSNLAIVLRDIGELEEARNLQRQALAAAEKRAEPGHRAIAVKQSNLALVLKDLGELQEARDLLRKALASDEKTFDPGHPTIATDRSNLAVVLGDLGEFEEARDLLRQALAADEKTFDPGHQSIARDQSNLALVLKNLKELDEARELLRTALASLEGTFEPGHPKTAILQTNLALVLEDLGNLDEARNLLTKAYAASLARLGYQHRQTQRIKSYLDALPPV